MLMTMRDMHCAVDGAIVTGYAVEVKEEMSVTDAQLSGVALIINSDTTEIIRHIDVKQPIFIRNNVLNEDHVFTYLGSIISNNCTLEREINERICKAIASLGRLSEFVYLNKNLKFPQKLKLTNQ